MANSIVKLSQNNIGNPSKLTSKITYKVTSKLRDISPIVADNFVYQDGDNFIYQDENNFIYQG